MGPIRVMGSLVLVGVFALSPAPAQAQPDGSDSVASSQISLGTEEDPIDLTLHQWQSQYPVFWLSDEDYCTLLASWIAGADSLGNLDIVRCQAQLALIAAQDLVEIPEAMLDGMRRVVGPIRGSLQTRDSGAISGSGTRTTEPFWLNGGDYRVTARKGKGKKQTVSAVLKDTLGETHATVIDPIAGEPGASQVVTLAPGAYYLHVVGSSAKWRVAWNTVR